MQCIDVDRVCHLKSVLDTQEAVPKKRFVKVVSVCWHFLQVAGPLPSPLMGAGCTTEFHTEVLGNEAL